MNRGQGQVLLIFPFHRFSVTDQAVANQGEFIEEGIQIWIVPSEFQQRLQVGLALWGVLVGIAQNFAIEVEVDDLEHARHRGFRNQHLSKTLLQLIPVFSCLGRNQLLQGFVILTQADSLLFLENVIDLVGRDVPNTTDLLQHPHPGDLVQRIEEYLDERQ